MGQAKRRGSREVRVLEGKRKAFLQEIERAHSEALYINQKKDYFNSLSAEEKIEYTKQVAFFSAMLSGGIF